MQVNQAISQLTSRRDSVFFFQLSDTLWFCPPALPSQADNRRSTLYRYSCRGHFRRVSRISDPVLLLRRQDYKNYNSKSGAL